MGVSFLAPLFLAGLAALAVPVVLHLRRRREGREVEFPSLMFLRDAPHRSERRKTIRNPWLLALRLLALGLLAFAFARPLFDREGEAAAAAGPREVVLLVDRSWSMTYGDRWAEARAAVDEVTTALRSGDRATLVLFDEEATAPVRSTRDAERVRGFVERTEPADGATRFAPALRLARSILEASDLPRREVVLVSDFQATGWSADDVARLPPAVTFVPRPVGSDGAWSNRSVASVEVRRERARGREMAIPTARLVARGDEVGATVAVLEVEGRERERVEARFEDGVADVEFGPVELGEEPLRTSVRIEKDALPPDDVHHRVLAPGRRLSVLVLEPASPRPNASLYLRRALELSRDPPVEVDVVSGVLPGELARYDVVVLNDRVPDRTESERLRSHLEGGGGVLAAPGVGGEVPGGERVLGVRIGEVRGPDPAPELRLGGLERAHPVFLPFREMGTGTFFDTRFFRTRVLEPTDSGQVVARFDDGSPALVEERIGDGRVLAWASTLHTFWTDLPVQPVFLPFVQRAVLHLADRSEIAPAFEVGDVLPAGTERAEEGSVAPPGPREHRAAVRTPAGELLEVDELEGPLRLRESGFYELLPDAEAGRGTPVAVNVDRREGDLGRRDPEEVAAAVTSFDEGATAAEQEAGGVAAATISTEDRERHQGVWRFLLAGAFLFLVGETLVSNLLVPARSARGGGAASTRRSGPAPREPADDRT